jgi:hypothetical protein
MTTTTADINQPALKRHGQQNGGQWRTFFHPCGHDQLSQSTAQWSVVMMRRPFASGHGSLSFLFRTLKAMLQVLCQLHGLKEKWTLPAALFCTI